MTYNVDETIKRFLPENSSNLNPLEFDWEEAENAIIFTADLEYPSFADFENSLTNYYTSLLGPEAQINPEGEDELGCISFWVKLGNDASELANRNIDIHIV